MIQLSPPALTPVTLKALQTYQQTVLAAGNYTAQADMAGSEFSRRNKKTNATFKEIRRALSDMCIGARRCHYCEDSVADEVEHIAPKTLYPDRCFVWDNYCYACGPCNGPKNNKYAVILPDNSRVDIPAHQKTVRPYNPPPAGLEALINPRVDNPLDYLFLDLEDTFFFSPLADPHTRDYVRADYTIDILGLNSRSYLVQARRNAYRNFRARVREYLHQHANGATAAELAILRNNLTDENHQTVWQEIKRQRHTIPELTRLFDALPDAPLWNLP